MFCNSTGLKFLKTRADDKKMIFLKKKSKKIFLSEILTLPLHRQI